MDALMVRREVCKYLESGGLEPEKLVEACRRQNVELLKHRAKQLSEAVGSSEPHAKAAAELAQHIDNHR